MNIHSCLLVWNKYILKLTLNENWCTSKLEANKLLLFLFRGARINRRDKDNFSPLLIAASNGHAATIKTLLQKGARLYDVDKNDKTALFWAAEEDNVEALEVTYVDDKSLVKILFLSKHLGQSMEHFTYRHFWITRTVRICWTSVIGMITHLCILQLRRATSTALR